MTEFDQLRGRCLDAAALISGIERKWFINIPVLKYLFYFWREKDENLRLRLCACICSKWGQKSDRGK